MELWKLVDRVGFEPTTSAAFLDALYYILKEQLSKENLLFKSYPLHFTNHSLFCRISSILSLFSSSAY